MAAQIANNTNRSLSLLTGVTTLLLPPTFITGVFGMNVNGLPFTDDEFGSSARWRCAPYRRSRCMSQCAAWVFCGNAARRWHGNYGDAYQPIQDDSTTAISLDLGVPA